MSVNNQNSKKELAEPSVSIAKTKEKLKQQDNVFLNLESLNPEEKKEALKSIGNWIAMHHNSRENLSSQSMGLFKNNEESAAPSRFIKQLQKGLKNNLTELKSK